MPNIFYLTSPCQLCVCLTKPISQLQLLFWKARNRVENLDAFLFVYQNPKEMSLWSFGVKQSQCGFPCRFSSFYKAEKSHRAEKQNVEKDN